MSKKPKNIDDMLHKYRHEYFWEFGKGRKKKSGLFFQKKKSKTK